MSIPEADADHFYIHFSDDNETLAVFLNQTVSEDSFSFKIHNASKETILQVNGTFRACDPSSSNTSTVIIAFLASLCLILLTGLALSLIILRRKKPITFKFGQKEDNEYEERQYNENLEYDNSSSKSSSFDVTNNMLTTPKIILPDSSPRSLQPRKSSLKPPRNSISDQINNNNNGSFDNTAFNSTELEVVNEMNEMNEDKQNELTINFDETRRKSIVTFSDQPEVNYR